MNNEDSLRFPIGKFSAKASYDTAELQMLIDQIESLPARIEALVSTFSDARFEMRYRSGGWTARQVLHHLPDSHMNGYIRMKWTLTEETPLIKAYNEKLWAETPETTRHPGISLNFLNALHVKWVALLRMLAPQHLTRSFLHPETNKQLSIERMIALYAWHGEHHLAHLKLVAAAEQ